ncbi:MAG: hypothetical protein ABW022_25140 [Actinoplanes sp.]
MSGNSTMKNFKEMLSKAKLPQRTLPLCLRGDLVGQIEDLERQLAEAERADATSHSIEDESDTVRIAGEIEALREEMRESTYTFVVQALPGPAFRELKEKHPPRENDEGQILTEDSLLDANYDTFLEPLLRACCVDPILDDETWSELEPKLSDNQYSQLLALAFYVNKGVVDVPFSHAASRLLRKNASE